MSDRRGTPFHVLIAGGGPAALEGALKLQLRLPGRLLRGDVTTRPLRQAGLAAQQSDGAATAIELRVAEHISA
jgi:hypothetical protein